MGSKTYKSSGVDVLKADRFVDAIKGGIKSTLNKNVITSKGAFGSLFALEGNYKKPVLVSSTDGVGTKLLVANIVNKHDTVGIDLVAMNINDILCVGAKPLFFLDYIACGKLNSNVLKKVVSGITEGCRQSGCALIGGETAEMPGMYKSDDYDLAGFAVGVVEQKNIIDGSKIKAGDKVIGLPSSGFHSNGYSLVRNVFSKAELKKHSKEILMPTKIYVKEVLPLIGKYKINGMAHITGGAFYTKLTKILPKGKCFAIDRTTWQLLNIFEKLQKKGKISDSQMFKTFNMGIGYCLVASEKETQKISKVLKSRKIKHSIIGEVINDKRRKIKI